MKQHITVLGATGSIGASTLDVIARHPQRYAVFALSAATRVAAMLRLCARFAPQYAVMHSPAHACQLAQALRAQGSTTQVLQGADALQTISSHPQVDMVMAAIVGAAGLAPCLAAAAAGKRLLLANKEALVLGGALFMATVQRHRATLIPVDSEHSAIFQCLPEDRSTWPQRVQAIVLTASGGPLRQRPLATLAHVTPEEACAHPNFSMGRKISVDSATMMNKALEVIEARWLFDMAPENIRVVIHPQQIVHSLVQFRDAGMLAQLGTPDMRVPIAGALAWPQRIASGAAALDFSQLGALTFAPPDAQRFPCLQLAWQVLRAPEGSSAVLNAANEVAVQAFLQRRLPFDRIYAVNHETLATVVPPGAPPASVPDLLALDAQARHAAQAQARRWEM